MNKQDAYGRCAKCKYARQTLATGNWIFIGCTHEPYERKWVVEIERCPKEDTDGTEKD